MPLSDQIVSDPPAMSPIIPSDPPKKKFASRDDFLNAAGKLHEAEVEVEGIGNLLLSEITGADRADIIGHSATALQAGKLDVKGYQRSLLLSGIVDPDSPAGDRKPLFRAGDFDRVMKVGGSKLTQAIDVIERLSSMGRYQETAEGNSAATPSDDSTSG